MHTLLFAHLCEECGEEASYGSSPPFSTLLLSYQRVKSRVNSHATWLQIIDPSRTLSALLLKRARNHLTKHVWHIYEICHFGFARSNQSRVQTLQNEKGRWFRFFVGLENASPIGNNIGQETEWGLSGVFGTMKQNY